MVGLLGGDNDDNRLLLLLIQIHNWFDAKMSMMLLQQEFVLLEGIESDSIYLITLIDWTLKGTVIPITVLLMKEFEATVGKNEKRYH